MRHYQGRDADRTLTPLESQFFREVENQGITVCSSHFWKKGVYLLALLPLIKEEGQEAKSTGSWLSLN